MAALIPEARAARLQAERLRAETLGLKLKLRESAACSREQLRAAEAALSQARARCDEPLPSPWSTLAWTYRYEGLYSTLVPLP